MSCTASQPQTPINDPYRVGLPRPRRATHPRRSAKASEKIAYRVLLRQRVGNWFRSVTDVLATWFRPCSSTDITVDEIVQGQAEANLHQSRKMQVIGNLAAGMAHDLNNVLAAVELNLSVVERELPPDSAAGKYLADALSASQRGADLIKNMLNYARGQVLDTVRLDVADLLREQRGILSRTLGARIKVETEIAAAVPAIVVNTAQMSTALMNLAINAAHAMPNGGKLRLSLREAVNDIRGELPAGHCVVIAVSDTGCGMSPDLRDRAFDSFFTTKGQEGTGLGLPMVRRFARQFGGDASIHSVAGEGTCVEIWLPAAA